MEGLKSQGPLYYEKYRMTLSFFHSLNLRKTKSDSIE